MLRNGIGMQKKMKAFVVTVAMVILGTTGYAQTDNQTTELPEMPFAILANGQTVQKSAQVPSPLVPFIVPVVLVGTGTCKATLTVPEPGSGEMVSIVAAGVCSGPYTVFDYNVAAADHSITAQVAVEEYGIVFFAGTLLAPASHFPAKLSFKIAF